ncbi:hypothetical protein WBJ53_19590 [Spirosoma sp. SC4-14]|uniref:hypothetical protein n=1 Tax=Spirosoma sp. SC4-14 TaxID=3128900 RepID=UPI0030D4D3C3
MAGLTINSLSLYAGSFIILLAKQANSMAIVPAFGAKLAAIMLEYYFDTDLLETFFRQSRRALQWTASGAGTTWS